MELTAIDFRLAEMKSRYEQGRGKFALLSAQKEDLENRLKETKENLELLRKVQVLLSKASEYAREQLKQKIEDTVTAALRAVVSDDLAFRITLSDRGGQPAAEWEVVSLYGGKEITNSPEDASGGGVVDVISIALRLALLELSRPKPGGPLILDEPGKMVSASYAPNLALFLKKYAQNTGRQVIMITHNDALAEVADKSYQVTLNDNGESVVRQIDKATYNG